MIPKMGPKKSRTVAEFYYVNDGWYVSDRAGSILPIVHNSRRNPGCVLSLVFGLLPKKFEAIYVKFFEKIREFLANPEVKVIITDFEIAAIKACSFLFPSATNRD